MRIKKKCVYCDSLERYKNGACKPCAKEKRKERYAKGLDTTQRARHEILLKNAILRNQANKNNEATYKSVIPCLKCDESERYASNNNCRYCNYEPVGTDYMAHRFRDFFKASFDNLNEEEKLAFI